MRLAQDTRRRELQLSTALPVEVAAAQRDAASGAAAASAAADEAITGDLIAASPTLGARIAAIEGRLDGLEVAP